MSAKEDADLAEALRLAEARPGNAAGPPLRAGDARANPAEDETVPRGDRRPGKIACRCQPNLRCAIESTPSLATAYEALELEDMARNYRRLSDETEKQIVGLGDEAAPNVADPTQR